MYENENFVTDASRLQMSAVVMYHKFLLTIKPNTADKAMAKILTLLKVRFCDTPDSGEIHFELYNIERVFVAKVYKRHEIIVSLYANIDWSEIRDSLSYLNEVTGVLHVVGCLPGEEDFPSEKNFGILAN